MNLEDIGFYTLSNYRAKQASSKSPLWRCELLLTDVCNFKCPYCRGLDSNIKGTLPVKKAETVIDYWISEGLKNVRLSGGEPTLYKGLLDLVHRCKKGNIERIAISTNGSAPIDLYQKLISAGVNDISISLDACCAGDFDKMSGTSGFMNKVLENIQQLSKLTYVTVGLVFNGINEKACIDTMMLADKLGVSDIRIIPSAQHGTSLIKETQFMKSHVIDNRPILKYRINNMIEGRPIRGINKTDTNKCWLALDDMAVAGDYHYPCIIYLREQGNPVGDMGGDVRQSRHKWVEGHDTHNDPICKRNCLDVCVDYNNQVEAQ